MNETIFEKEYLRPSLKIDHREDMNWKVFVLWLIGILILFLITAYVHFAVEPQSGTIVKDAKSQISYQSDKELCAMIVKGTPVKGANPSQIELYCMTRG